MIADASVLWSGASVPGSSAHVLRHGVFVLAFARIRTCEAPAHRACCREGNHARESSGWHLPPSTTASW
jgi:hypothetical protein